MFDKQQEVKIKLIRDKITLDEFYFKYIKSAGISNSRFRNMYYGTQFMTIDVLEIIEKYLGESDERTTD